MIDAIAYESAFNRSKLKFMLVEILDIRIAGAPKNPKRIILRLHFEKFFNRSSSLQKRSKATYLSGILLF